MKRIGENYDLYVQSDAISLDEKTSKTYVSKLIILIVAVFIEPQEQHD